MLALPGYTLVVSFRQKTYRAAMRASALALASLALVGSYSRAAAQDQPGRALQITAPASGPDVGDQQPGATDLPGQPGLVHIVPFGRDQIKNAFAPAGAHLTYFGGPVISQVHAVAVFWGPNVNTAVTADIAQFFTDITNSRYYDLLTEYSTTGITSAAGATSNQSIQRGVLDGSFPITPSLCNVTPPTTCAIDDTQIQSELRNQINAGHLPAPVSDAQGNVNSFYMIYFPPGVSITVQGVSGCVRGGFCAYHSNTPNTLSPKLVPYGVLPDFGPTSGCSTGCGRGTVFQNATAVTSHELSEAVTDAQVGSATAFAPPLAWYDPDPAANPLAEIGDICGGQDVLVTAGLTNYFVQQEFSNVQNDCVSAPPNFNLSPPTDGVVPAVSFNLPLTIQGSTGPITLTGYAGTVHFTSSDPTAVLPADYTFTAADAGTHTFPVTLSTLGDQTITVTDTRSAGFVGSATTNVNTTPDLSITKAHAGNFTLGQSGSYTITVANVGHGPTTAAVTVVDTLPTGLTATAIGGTGWSCTLATLTCTRADALARSSSYPAITLAVNITANAPSSVTNVATVSGGGETNTANDSASDVAQVAAPDMIVSKSHAGVINGSFFQGETGATYRIDVINNGNASTTAPVTVVDTLPPSGLTATGISGTGWTCTLPNLTCTRSDVLPGGASYPFITVTVDVAANAPSNVTNTANVAGGGETNTGNNVSQDLTIVLPPPATDLSISVFHALPGFIQGQTGAYTIVVSDIGTQATSGTVTVTDSLPAGLTATAMSGTGWTCDLATLTCTRNDVLAFNSSYPQISLNVNVAANAPSSVTNTVSVSGGGDANAANNTAGDFTAIAIPLVDLSMVVSHPGNFTQGQLSAPYDLAVSNGGNVPSSGTVTAVASVPSGMTVSILAGSGWSCVLSTLTCTRSDALNPNSTYPLISLNVNVASNLTGTVVASATVSGGGDSNASNNAFSNPTVINPALTITPIGAQGVTVSAGQSAKFTFQLNAEGTAGAVTFNCTGLPTGASCSFSPASLLPSSTQVSMTVSTTARTSIASGQFDDRRPASPFPFGFALLSGLLLLIMARLKRAKLKYALAFTGLAVALGLVACGGHDKQPQIIQNPNGTPAGTYIVTVTATGASAGSATQTFTLTVN
ncbi:MAG TPA: hypothetical protein VF532_13915 [Candidatus Angelobacter sp.]